MNKEKNLEKQNKLFTKINSIEMELLISKNVNLSPEPQNISLLIQEYSEKLK